MWSYKERFGLSTAAGRYFLALSLGKHMEDDFNKSKCRVMHMTHKKTCACLPTCMREVPLVPTNTRKHLGVQLTSNLSSREMRVLGQKVTPPPPKKKSQFLNLFNFSISQFLQFKINYQFLQNFSNYEIVKLLIS